MTPEQRASLQEIVDASGLARIFKDLDALGARLERFAAHYAARSHGLAHGALPASPVTLDSVVAEFRSNPYRVQVLLQAIGFVCSLEMLVMIWMAELGCAIQNLTVRYERREHVVLEIELRLLDATTPLTFRSTEIWDLAVLRFVGLAKTNDEPEMNGFYPLSLPG